MNGSEGWINIKYGNINPLFCNFQLNVHSQNGSNSSVVLYLGLIISSVGLIIFLVGVGEKGFKSLELQLIGPSLIGETSFLWSYLCTLSANQYANNSSVCCSIDYKKVTLKNKTILLSGIGLLMAFFQILYCSKPWKNISCIHCCGSKQKEESRKVKEKDHLNSAVIKIRSFNEFTQPQSRQLGTITEFSRNISTRRLSLEEVDGWK